MKHTPTSKKTYQTFSMGYCLFCMLEKIRRFLFGRLIVFALLVFSNAIGAATNTGNSANSKFLIYQPWESHNTIDETIWANLGKDLNKLGYTHVIFQWGQYGDFSFWPDKGGGFLNRITNVHGTGKLKFIFGLYIGDDYYHKLGATDDQLEAYLAKSRELTLVNAKEIVRQKKNINGWYLPEEVDDYNWRTAKRQRLLFQHFSILATSLEVLKPNTPIYASAFFGGTTMAQTFARQLTEISTATKINWLIQDGLGTNRMTENETAEYLKKMAKHLPPTKWRGILEIFTIKKNEDGSSLFCRANQQEIKKRIKIWKHSTTRIPSVIFSGNQLASQYLNQSKCLSLQTTNEMDYQKADQFKFSPNYKPIIPLGLSSN